MIRHLGAGVLVVVSVSAALAFSVFRYIDSTLLSPQGLVEVAAPLAQNADVRDHLWQALSSELVDLADQEIAESQNVVLSPTAEEIFDQIERDKTIENIVIGALEDDRFVAAFESSMQEIAPQIQRTAELEEFARLSDDGSIYANLRPIYALIYERLAADPLTAPVSALTPPDDLGILKVADRSTGIDLLWTIAKSTSRWKTLSLVFAVLAGVAAVALAISRPSTISQLGGGLIGVGIVSIVVIYLARMTMPLLVAEGSHAGAIGAVYKALIAPLVVSLLYLAGAGAVLMVLGRLARFVWPEVWETQHQAPPGVVPAMGWTPAQGSVNVPGLGYQVPPQQYPQYPGYPPAGYQAGYPASPYQGYPPQGYVGYPPPGYPPPGYAGYVPPQAPSTSSQPTHQAGPESGAPAQTTGLPTQSDSPEVGDQPVGRPARVLPRVDLSRSPQDISVAPPAEADAASFSEAVAQDPAEDAIAAADKQDTKPDDAGSGEGDAWSVESDW